ncbi:MAG: formylglycine-generating enzyme family protein [Verrucomicrobiaceae bacterium]|nr:formylglycine-generating enzyme family protein [Verrucomicrobiaceae bacterium]
MTAPASTHYIAPAIFKGQEGTDGGDEVIITLPGGVQMHFCWCPRPAQPFQIGSPAGEADRLWDEKPTWVTLSHGFWLAKHPCSQAQWLALGMENRSHFTGDLSRPVENVNDEDMKAFFAAATIPTDWHITLPTEAQWEYACRAGGGIEQPFGISKGRGLHGQIANFDATVPYGGGFEWLKRGETLPEGSFPPNAWGLHDMHGQLWEWCADGKAGYPASSAEKPLKDPIAHLSGSSRVLRGGSWIDHSRDCRAAFRGSFDSGDRSGFFGFRPALVPGAPDERSGGSAKERGGRRK